MIYSTKKLLVMSFCLSFIAALLTAIYLSSFGLDLSTFYVDLSSALIIWLIIMPFIVKGIKYSN
jgi:hypothetical protein